jgi:hypothetical protein
MRRLRPSRLVLLSICCVLVIPAVAHAAATRAEYVAQADPVCASADRDIHRLNKHFSRLDRDGRYGAAGRTLKRTGTRLSASIAQVRSITPPPGDVQTISSWLEEVARIAGNNRRMGTAEAQQRFRRVFALQVKNFLVARRAHELVADWGFHACIGQ